MDLEFFEPAEAAALMLCCEGWRFVTALLPDASPMRAGAKEKIVFTSEHIAEIARISEILSGSHPSPDIRERSSPNARLIGTRARKRMAS